jgi:hypothetical protein
LNAFLIYHYIKEECSLNRHGKFNIIEYTSRIEASLQRFRENSTISNNMPTLFEYTTSFDFVKENGDTVLYRLHIGDVLIKLEEGENYAIIKAIFCHKQEDDIRFAFVAVDWFEDMNQTILGCPVFRLRVTSNWRKVFSINLVEAINTVHFVHSCKVNECVESVHDSKNSLYMRNIYFFKAV